MSLRTNGHDPAGDGEHWCSSRFVVEGNTPPIAREVDRESVFVRVPSGVVVETPSSVSTSSQREAERERGRRNRAEWPWEGGSRRHCTRLHDELGEAARHEDVVARPGRLDRKGQRLIGLQLRGPPTLVPVVGRGAQADTRPLPTVRKFRQQKDEIAAQDRVTPVPHAPVALSPDSREATDLELLPIEESTQHQFTSLIVLEVVVRTKTRDREVRTGEQLFETKGILRAESGDDGLARRDRGLETRRRRIAQATQRASREHGRLACFAAILHSELSSARIEFPSGREIAGPLGPECRTEARLPIASTLLQQLSRNLDRRFDAPRPLQRTCQLHPGAMRSIDSGLEGGTIARADLRTLIGGDRGHVVAIGGAVVSDPEPVGGRRRSFRVTERKVLQRVIDLARRPLQPREVGGFRTHAPARRGIRIAPDRDRNLVLESHRASERTPAPITIRPTKRRCRAKHLQAEVYASPDAFLVDSSSSLISF